MRALVALSCLLAGIAGCTLPRSALGTPGDGATIDGGGIDAFVGPGDDTGVDGGAGIDAFVDDTGLDAYAAPDAFAYDGGPDTNVDAYTPVDTGCVPGTTACVAAEVWGCDSDFSMRWRETCTRGCATAPMPHCMELRASHVTDESLLPSGTTALMVSGGQTVQIDTGTGAITLLPSTVIRAAGATTGIGFTTQTVTGAPELAIFTFSTIRVANGGTLTATGPRALVLLSAGDVTIDGTIEMSAGGILGGPGGFSGGGHQADGGGPGHGAHGGIDGTFDDLMSGGGGGGHGGTGGGGGPEDGCCGESSDGGARGVATMADADGSLLLGGSGGAGGANGSTGGVGGGGGGVVQITSRGMIRVSGSGIVRAVGAGGGPGHEAGGGGGAGGTIFLEALTITIDGILTVNGGAGGGGGSSGGTGGRGTDTTMLSIPGGGSSGGGRGGGGAAGSTFNGQDGSEGDGGGGGGGGGGRIFVVTTSGATLSTGTPTPSGAIHPAMATIR